MGDVEVWGKLIDLGVTWVIANVSPFVPYYGMQTEVQDFVMLAGGYCGESCGLCNLPTKIYSAKASEFLTLG